MVRRWGLPFRRRVGGLSWCLRLAGSAELVGVDTGKGGMALLVTEDWVLLFAAQSLPRGDLDRAASPAEWKAWTGVVFMAVAVAYFLAKIRVFQGAGVPFNPEATAVGRNLVLLLVAWAVLSRVVAQRGKGPVQGDGRAGGNAPPHSGRLRGARLGF